VAYNEALLRLVGVGSSIIAGFSCLIEVCGEDRTDTFQRCTMTGQDATDRSCIVKVEIPIRPQEKDFAQGRQSDTGAGCPARFCSLHAWRYLKWTGDEP